MVVGSGVQDLVLACWFAGMLPNTAGCSVGGVAMLVLACWLGGGQGLRGSQGWCLSVGGQSQVLESLSAAHW